MLAARLARALRGRGQASNDVAFVYGAPQLDSLQNAEGKVPGTTDLVLKGANFGAGAGGSRVEIVGYDLNGARTDETVLAADASAGGRTTASSSCSGAYGNATVHVGAERSQNGRFFDYSPFVYKECSEVLTAYRTGHAIADGYRATGAAPDGASPAYLVVAGRYFYDDADGLEVTVGGEPCVVGPIAGRTDDGADDGPAGDGLQTFEPCEEAGCLCAGLVDATIETKTLTCVVPEGTGAANEVLVIRNGRESFALNASQHDKLLVGYLPPEIATVSPATLPTTGGVVTLTGATCRPPRSARPRSGTAASPCRCARARPSPTTTSSSSSRRARAPRRSSSSSSTASARSRSPARTARARRGRTRRPTSARSRRSRSRRRAARSSTSRAPTLGRRASPTSGSPRAASGAAAAARRGARRRRLAGGGALARYEVEVLEQDDAAHAFVQLRVGAGEGRRLLVINASGNVATVALNYSAPFFASAEISGGLAELPTRGGENITLRGHSFGSSFGATESDDVEVVIGGFAGFGDDPGGYVEWRTGGGGGGGARRRRGGGAAAAAAARRAQLRGRRDRGREPRGPERRAARRAARRRRARALVQRHHLQLHRAVDHDARRPASVELDAGRPRDARDADRRELRPRGPRRLRALDARRLRDRHRRRKLRRRGPRGRLWRRRVRGGDTVLDDGGDDAAGRERLTFESHELALFRVPPGVGTELAVSLVVGARARRTACPSRTTRRTSSAFRPTSPTRGAASVSIYGRNFGYPGWGGGGTVAVRVGGFACRGVSAGDVELAVWSVDASGKPMLQCQTAELTVGSRERERADRRPVGPRRRARRPALRAGVLRPRRVHAVRAARPRLVLRGVLGRRALLHARARPRGGLAAIRAEERARARLRPARVPPLRRVLVGVRPGRARAQLHGRHARRRVLPRVPVRLDVRGGCTYSVEPVAMAEYWRAPSTSSASPSARTGARSTATISCRATRRTRASPRTRAPRGTRGCAARRAATSRTRSSRAARTTPSACTSATTTTATAASASRAPATRPSRGR